MPEARISNRAVVINGPDSAFEGYNIKLPVQCTMVGIPILPRRRGVVQTTLHWADEGSIRMRSTGVT